MRKLFATIVIVGALTAPASRAAPTASVDPGAVTVSLSAGGEGGQMSSLLKIVLLLTAIAFAPAILVCVTSFTRIVIVLAFARQAIGTQQTPPNQVIIGIALFLTLFTMGPTAGRIEQAAVEPYLAQEIGEADAFDRGVGILKSFMLSHTRRDDLILFYDISKLARPSEALDIPLRIVVPSFIISELKTAFQMGFLIFVPFLLIDLVVSSILMAMGMMMLPPVLIALPFKILLFVLVDGWHLLVGSLVQSFA